MNLRNEIKEMLKTHLPIGKVIASREELDEPLTKIVNLQANKVLDEATDQILSLLEGSLPEGKENVVFMEKHTDRYEKTEEYHLRDKKGIAYIAYGDGWNDCLEEIKERLHK